MIAKVIAFGSTRDEARTRLDQALSKTKLLGTATNVEYLRSILTCESAFLLSFLLDWQIFQSLDTRRYGDFTHLQTRRYRIRSR